MFVKFPALSLGVANILFATSWSLCTLIVWNGNIAQAQTSPRCANLPVTVDMNNGDVPTPNNDVILGTPFADDFNAGAGDDVVCGGGGDDRIFGGIGADTIYGQGGNDTLYGGCADNPACNESADFLIGGIGNDTLQNNTNVDSIAKGGPGVDVLSGWGYLYGGSGEDTLYSDENAKVFGQTGGDTIVIFSFEPGEAVEAYGGAGDDVITVISLPFLDPTQELPGHILHGGAGKDSISSGSGNDQIYGGGGDDNIYVSVGSHIVFAGSGNDTVEVLEQDIGPSTVLAELMVDGNAGDDILSCGVGYSCMFFGGSGNDTLTGSDEGDILNGNGGNDTVFGMGGADEIRGHDGDDELFGGVGIDIVRGGAGDDIVFGGNTGDIVQGNTGFDQCDDLSNASCEVSPPAP